MKAEVQGEFDDALAQMQDPAQGMQMAMSMARMFGGMMGGQQMGVPPGPIWP